MECLGIATLWQGHEKQSSSCENSPPFSSFSLKMSCKRTESGIDGIFLGVYSEQTHIDLQTQHNFPSAEKHTTDKTLWNGFLPSFYRPSKIFIVYSTCIIFVCKISRSLRDLLFCFLAHFLMVLYRGHYITNPDNALLRANQIPRDYYRVQLFDPPQK